MSHPSKKKGSRYEREVADWLVANGFPNADRMVLKGTADQGDIAGVPMLTLECKNEKQMSLSSYVDEAVREGENAHTPWAAAVVKRRGRSVSESYVVLPLSMFSRLYRTYLDAL